VAEWSKDIVNDAAKIMLACSDVCARYRLIESSITIVDQRIHFCGDELRDSTVYLGQAPLN